MLLRFDGIKNGPTVYFYLISFDFTLLLGAEYCLDEQNVSIALKLKNEMKMSAL